MAAIYRIKQGETESPVMDTSAASMVVLVTYFNGANPVQPTTDAALSISPDATGETFTSLVSYGRGEWRYNGPVARVRLDITGVAGVTSATASIWRDDESMEAAPAGAYSGLRALTTQSYTEANVKNGVQFYIQHNLPQLAATTGVYKLLFTTGAKPVLVKGREMYGIGETFSLQVYKQPTAPTPGGTLLTVQNYNDIAAAATTVTVRGGVNTTADGTPWGDPQRLFGQSAAGQRAGSGLAPGGDRVLKPNSSYLVVFRNTGSGTADIDYFLTWYEGGTDLPLRQ